MLRNGKPDYAVASKAGRRLQNHTPLPRRLTLAPHCLPLQFQQRPNMQTRPKYASVMLCHGACIGRRRVAPRRNSVTAPRPRRVVAGTLPDDSIATAVARGRRRHSGRRFVCSAPLGTATVPIGSRRSPRPQPRATNRGCAHAL